jgi:hypothetical protein
MSGVSVRLSRARKFLYGFGTTVVLIGMLEGAARTYSAVRFGNERALWYGWDFIGRIWNGTVTIDERRDIDPDARLGVAAEALFEHRSDPGGDGLTWRRPYVTLVNGRPAHINSYGYRGPEFTPPVSGEKRIGAFGGSYVFGALLSDEETWPVLLHDDLRRRGMEVAVLNAGVNGTTIHGVLTDVIRVTNRVPLTFALVTSAYNNHPLLPIERRFTLARNVNVYLYNLSMLDVLMTEKIGRLRGEPLSYSLYHQAVRVKDADVESLVALYRRRLIQIQTVCRERGVTLVLSSQPEVFFDAALNRTSTFDEPTVGRLRRRIQTDGMLYLAELDFYLQARFNREARRVAADAGLPFFDGASVLADDKTVNFADEIHPSPLGARRLAAALAHFFEPLLTADVHPAS